MATAAEIYTHNTYIILFL